MQWTSRATLKFSIWLTASLGGIYGYWATSAASPTLSAAGIALPNALTAVAISSAYIIPNSNNVLFTGFTYPTVTFNLQIYNPITNIGGSGSFILKAIWQSTSYFVASSVADNFNGNDYVYACVIGYPSFNLNIGVFQISQLLTSQSGTTTQTLNLFASPNGYITNTGTSLYMLLYNLGSYNYIMAVDAETARGNVYLIAKTFSASFGTSPTALNLPKGRHHIRNLLLQRVPLRNHREFWLVLPNHCLHKSHQQSPSSQTASEQPYRETDNNACLTGSPAPVGYRDDTPTWTIQPCTVSNCGTCPARFYLHRVQTHLHIVRKYLLPL